MNISDPCPLAYVLAERLRVAREVLVERWLERIAARVALDPNRVFPTDELLDHVPILIDGIADYLENPAEEIAADVPVVGKAMELGALRWQQGFDAYQIMKEYEILGGIIHAFLIEIVDDIEQSCTRSELLRCSHRLFRAIALIQQVTTMHYLRMLGEQVREREERLRRFNRMVSHELKTRIGAIVGGAALLQEEWIDATQRERFVRMVAENAGGAGEVLDNLLQLSRMDGVPRQQRNVLLPQSVAEAARQLRDFAIARGIRVEVAGELPPIEVNAAAVELCLTNLVSNAIKYSDPARRDRWVRIGGRLAPGPNGGPRELVIEVTDNGLGVPVEERAALFSRFHRAHERTVTGVEGTGLGLNIVRETVESLGGRTWADFDQPGVTVFAFSLPHRRSREVVVAPPGAGPGGPGTGSAPPARLPPG